MVTIDTVATNGVSALYIANNFFFYYIDTVYLAIISHNLINSIRKKLSLVLGECIWYHKFYTLKKKSLSNQQTWWLRSATLIFKWIL